MQQNDKEILTNFGKLLKELREQKKISLNKFALNSDDLTSATLSRIENGLVDFKFTTLIKISNALNISLSELFKNFK
ncbi:MAG: helix-turn-helix domain-containing protein [Candidatus Gastranaerophilaceae bacterium]